MEGLEKVEEIIQAKIANLEKVSNLVQFSNVVCLKVDDFSCLHQTLHSLLNMPIGVKHHIHEKLSSDISTGTGGSK